MFKTLRFTLVSLLMMVCGTVFADDSRLVFTSACGGTGTAEDGAVWTVTSDGEESSYDNTKGIHYGTGSKAVGNITLSTSSITGTITSVVVNASTATGVTATVDVTVGGNAFGGDAQALSSAATDYTFEGSASGEIVVTVKKPSSANKALYVKSIVVTYANGETPPAPSVATPVITPNGGTFIGQSGVTISCETEGATIYYTTDGTTPSSTNGQRYTRFSVTETTTVKAVAVKDEAVSAVATATFTIIPGYATIAELNALESGTAFGFTGEAFVVAVAEKTTKSGTAKYVYIHDNSGNSLIYDGSSAKTAAVEAGRFIDPNWTGKVSIYNKLFELVPDEALTVGVSKYDVNYPDFSTREINKVVSLKNVESYTVNGTSITINVKGADKSFEESYGLAGYNQFGLEDAVSEEGKLYEIIGVVGKYEDKDQFWAISITEQNDEPIVPEPDPEFYVVGNMTDWQIVEANKMTLNEELDKTGVKEFSLDMTLAANDEFKVVSSTDGSNIKEWFPAEGDNYEVSEAGEYTIYFRPNNDGDETWHEKCLKAEKKAAPVENVEELTDLVVNGTFDQAGYIAPWKTTGGFQNQTTANNQSGAFGIENSFFFENWNGSAKVNKMYQTIENIPNGTYKLKIAAFVNVFANPNESQYVFANNDKVFLTAGEPTAYEVTTVVTDNKIEIGLEQTTATANWMGIDNVSLTYIGPKNQYVKEIAKMNFDVKQSVKTAGALKTAYEAFVADESDANKEALKAAIEATKVSANSYAVLEAGVLPDNSLAGWNCTNTNTFHINTWSVEGNSDGTGMKTPFIENWCNKNDGYLGVGEIYYSLPGLDPGVYQFSALIRAYSESGNEPTGASLFAGDREKEFATGHNFEYNGMKGIYDTYAMACEVGEDGVFKFGIKIAEERNFNWMAFKNCKVSYVGGAIDAAAVAELAATMPEGKMNAEVKTAAETAIATATETPNLDNYEAAAKAIAAASASVEAYSAAETTLAAMKELVDATNFYTADALDAYYTTPKEKFDNGTLTTEEANALQNPATVTGHRAAVTVDNFLLSVWDTNPDFVDAPYYINTWSKEGESDGTEFKVPFFEYWTGDANSLSEKTLTATLQLGTAAVGKIADVNIWVRARAKNDVAAADATGITLKVNDGEAVDVTEGETNGQFNIAKYTARGVVGEDSTLVVKFVVAADNNISWFSFKNAMYELKDETQAAYEDALAAIENGKTYRVFTQVGDNKFYLNTTGYLVADVKKAATFTFTADSSTPTDGSTLLYPSGWNLGCKFTNATLSDKSSGDVVKNGHIMVGSNNRSSWERQVFFLKDGKYAVRATNANSANWGANTYWIVDNEEAELPNAEYGLEPAYVWQIEANVDNRPAAFAKVKTWAYKLQQVEGLVNDKSQWSSNAGLVKGEDGQGFPALYDGNGNTYFHTAWKGSGVADPGADHYIQAELPDAVEKFYFYFYKRGGSNNNNRPTKIDISAGNDATNLSAITSITEGLPTAASVVDYISGQIDLGAAYNNIRFTVSETNSGNKYGDHVFFSFGEFYILPSNELTDAAVQYMVADYTDLDTDESVIEAIDAIDAQIAVLVAQKDLEGDIAALGELVDKLQAKVDATDTYTDEFNVAASVTGVLNRIKGMTYTTKEDLDRANAAVKEQADVFFGNIKAVQDIDITDFYIVNATPTANHDGWEVINGTAGNQWAGNTYDAANNVAEFWNYAGSTIKQAISLPAGEFKLSAQAVTRTDMVGTLFAGENKVNIVTMPASGEGTGLTDGVDGLNSRGGCNTWFTAGNGWNDVKFTLAEAGEIEIGITSDAETGDHWTVWRGFTLVLPAPVAPQPTTYAVNVAETENGEVSVSKTEAAAGETVEVVVTPAGGYIVDEAYWSYFGADGALQTNEFTEPEDASNSATFVMPAADVTITVTFKVEQGDGINGIAADEKTVIFDMNGRRVSRNAKGVLIINGKKQVRK